jgi:enoyl-CoA hydratase
MQIESHGDVALLRMQGGKANAMTAEFLGDLVRLVDELEASDAGAAVIIGEGPHFSAGLALPSLIDLDRASLREFIDIFAAAMLSVFRCQLPVIAAVNGHAIAGGCVLALQADVRLMAEGKGKIGLTEVQLGIGLPSVVLESLRLQLPPTSLFTIALEGRLFGPGEAYTLRLVDDVCPAATLERLAIERATALARLPRAGYAQVKAGLRRPAVEAITRHGDEERERWLDSWYSDDAQKKLREQVAKLTAAKP